jgi:hypothetical protein
MRYVITYGQSDCDGELSLLVPLFLAYFVVVGIFGRTCMEGVGGGLIWKRGATGIGRRCAKEIPGSLVAACFLFLSPGSIVMNLLARVGWDGMGLKAEL